MQTAHNSIVKAAAAVMNIFSQLTKPIIFIFKFLLILILIKCGHLDLWMV